MTIVSYRLLVPYLTKIEFGHFQSRRPIKWLWWWCLIQQPIQKFWVWWSHFVPVSVKNWGQWFFQFWGQGRLIHHLQSTVLHFDVFFIFFNWAAAVLCITCWLCTKECQQVSCALLLFVFWFCFFFFFQFISFYLRLTDHMHLTGGWSTFFFLKGGGAVCALYHLISWKIRYINQLASCAANFVLFWMYRDVTWINLV